MLRGNKVLLKKDFEIFKRRLLLLQHHYSDCFISKPVLGHCSMQKLQIKVQVPPVCGASSGTANMYREGRFSFQPFSRAMNVYKLLFDPSGFGISYSTILPCPPLVFFQAAGEVTAELVQVMQSSASPFSSLLGASFFCGVTRPQLCCVTPLQ